MMMKMITEEVESMRSVDVALHNGRVNMHDIMREFVTPLRQRVSVWQKVTRKGDWFVVRTYGELR